MSEDRPPYRIEPIALSDESTVVAEFVAAHAVRETGYQGETALEQALIEQLQAQAYAYLPITSEADMIVNLCRQLGRRTKTEFSAGE